ncbi:molybdopterin-dependent oxidoreductase [Asanoa iriomotensis]|uniref:Molybdopterin-binding protein n=1 Tax=Asanoa iriomotensis TaxID=234613 RepID=A0ABQ4C221_9ACTN|nr:molybdopterin-dependent oxidoreductase [Asanoa iriomotensis]GIF56784.1 molybdopterin-binding protein [Asanoa iriomotensis]
MRAPAPHAASRLGLWLAVAFGVCFVTGLLSHAIQHPPAWFWWPSRPVQLYRVNQGLHVLSGVAAVPLLLAKLWTVYPRLFLRPPRAFGPLVRHAAERVATLVLVCSAFFELVTGLFNVAQSYPWRFFFPAAHYAVAWLAVGAIGVHVAIKLPVARSARPDPERRAFLRSAGVTAAAALVATAGVTVPWLRSVSPLAWRAGPGPQGVPVNRTAAAAHITVPDDWHLDVRWAGGSATMSLATLHALRQRTARLPIACVEGWSADADWTGVPLRDLLGAVGAPTDRPVRVSSLEKAGLYASSVLPRPHARDPLTLLALRLNGETLSPDHGFPCRIIAPNRPGVLQTKWVTLIEVLP